MVGNLMADLGHLTNPAIKKCAIENLRQDDLDLVASVAKGLGL